MIITKRVIFSGTVQHVFFRDFVKTNADTLGVKGYVKNTNSGEVEAVFEGEKNTINKLIDMCRKGPKTAHVENVKIEDIPVKSHKNFDISY